MQQIGHPFITLQKVTSTNNYAMQLVQEGLAKHGTAVFALQQTAGKGQRGKAWHSQPGSNIILSVVLQPALQLNQQFILSMAVANACHQFFNKYAGDETKIKWPNDIYWRDRKAGGILIENIISGGKWQYAIVGIGININQTRFDANLYNPVSLKQITGKQFDVAQLAQELCGYLQKEYTNLQQQPYQNIAADYNAVLYKKNQQVKLKKDNAVFETTICEVTPFGQLKTNDVIERFFDFGTVEWQL